MKRGCKIYLFRHGRRKIVSFAGFGITLTNIREIPSQIKRRDRLGQTHQVGADPRRVGGSETCSIELFFEESGCYV